MLETGYFLELIKYRTVVPWAELSSAGIKELLATLQLEKGQILFRLRLSIRKYIMGLEVPLGSTVHKIYLFLVRSITDLNDTSSSSDSKV